MQVMARGQSEQIADTILNGFNRHFTIFSKITRGARERFENADWHAEREASRERIKFYDIRVKDCIRDLQKQFKPEPFDSQLWFDVKREYVLRISNHLQTGFSCFNQTGTSRQWIQPALRGH